MKRVAVLALVSSVALLFEVRRRSEVEPPSSRRVDSPARPAAGLVHRIALDAVPLVFEPNAGQFSPQTRFAARDRFTTLRFERGGVRFDDALFLRVAGDVEPEPAEPVATRVSYFIGSDPARWRTDLPTWGAMRYRVGPGSEVVFHAWPGRLEYDLHLAPGSGASPAVAFEGADALVEQPGGEWHIAVDGRVFVQRAEPGVRFVRDGVRLVPADPAPLVDPIIDYATYYGSTLGDLFNAVAVDSSGAMVLFGGASSKNLVTTAGGVMPTPSPSASSDFYIVKLDPTGTSRVFATYLGGSSTEVARAMALDTAGNVYGAGYTQSTDFPTTAGVTQQAYGGGSNDGVVFRLNASGSTLGWATFLGGILSEDVTALTVDGSGNAYLAGTSTGGSFPTVAGAFQQTYGGGGTDAFAVKLNPTATTKLYSTYLGSAGIEVGKAIAADATGAAYVLGTTDNTAFPTTIRVRCTCRARDRRAPSNTVAPRRT